MLPDAGDIHWAELDPVLGSEQAGRRPVIILTPRVLHEVSRRVIVCPITSRRLAWSTTVLLPDDMKLTGSVLADQIRSVDRAARIHDFIERAPTELLSHVRAKLAAMLEL